MNLPQPPEPRSTSHRRPQVHSTSAEKLGFALPSTRVLDWQIEQPFAVTVPLQAPEVRTIGCLFPEGAAALRGDEPPAAPPAAVQETQSPSTTSQQTAKKSPLAEFGLSTCTRVRPPRDVVKLEDRLFYLLQPPLENIFSSESLSFPFRPFPYQYDGIAFLYPRNEAVLADEMGLGKTMQAIVAMRLLAHQGQVRRTLLVCPKPLVTNWQREIAMWAPELPVTVIEGKQSRREWLWQNAKTGVLLANYESLIRDQRHALAVEEPFDLMITDETQRIKNRLSTTNQVVCSIPRRRSWALTGTPIENSTEDLVGIFQFVSPGCLQPQMKTASIRKAVDDYVIRRTKDHVLKDLPPKLFRDADVILTPEQQQAYDLAENEGVVRLNELHKELTIQHVFELVLRLKQICNFDPVTGASAKLDRLEADLEECAASGRKAIVFSQWVNTIEKLKSRLERFSPLEYHGKIPSKHRDGVIESFRSNPDHHVLLMSYGAGSVGLNLQFAGYVFLFDRWWNPAVEDQAINRAHRIGAAGPVTVTRFLASGTIEDRINLVLEEKRELFNSVFDPEATTGKLGLSREEIFGLFQLRFPDNGNISDAA
ncbi:MAG: DEAD/DEAH box helicase [Planctomycetes bacterium]|nr:DEAD/DEAH box helicase [Planctomycetota bacterium]